jgi:hypothetical protein
MASRLSLNGIGPKCPVCFLSSRYVEAKGRKSLAIHLRMVHPAYRFPHKICFGPLHPNGKYLTPDDFHYFHQRNKLRPRGECKECKRYKENKARGSEWVPISKFEQFFKELVRRTGSIPNASRAAGIALNTGYNIVRRSHSRYERQVVQKVMSALAEARRTC